MLRKFKNGHQKYNWVKWIARSEVSLYLYIILNTEKKINQIESKLGNKGLLYWRKNFNLLLIPEDFRFKMFTRFSNFRANSVEFSVETNLIPYFNKVL